MGELRGGDVMSRLLPEAKFFKTSDEKYEMAFEDGWAGIPLHLYNLSKKTVEILINTIRKISNIGGANFTEIMQPIFFYEDMRCRELDDFLEKFRPIIAAGKIEEARKDDEWSRIGAPQFLFKVEDPYKEANWLRDVFQRTKLSYSALIFYLYYYNGVTKSEMVIREHKKEIEELAKKGYAINVSKMPAQWLLTSYFPLKILQEVAKTKKIDIKAQKKQDFVDKLLEKLPERKIVKLASKTQPIRGFHFKPIEDVSSAKAKWFYDYLTLVPLIIFGTLNDKVENTFLLYEFGRVKIHGDKHCCRKCQEYSGLIVKSLDKLPPYHLGCCCLVSPDT